MISSTIWAKDVGYGALSGLGGVGPLGVIGVLGGGPGYKAEGVGGGSSEDIYRAFGLLGSGVCRVEGLKDDVDARGSSKTSDGGTGP